MTENKLAPQTLLSSLFLALPFLCLSVPAQAQNSMMGLAYVDEIILQTPRLGNPVDSRKCDLSENSISDFALEKLKIEGLPIFSLLDSPPLVEKNARIYIVPEITTMEIRGEACLSYISLTAKSQAILPVPPVAIPRNVTITYWSAGLMVNSSRAGHARVIEGGFEKLSELFGREFRLAHPPLIVIEKKK